MPDHPTTPLLTVVLEALREEGIPARVVSCVDFDPPFTGQLTPDQIAQLEEVGEKDVYVLVPETNWNAACEVLRCMHRVCQNCYAILPRKAHSCEKCGTRYETEPAATP